MTTWAVRVGDCRERMAQMEENSVDAIVTDPPYGLAFMGKEWDHGLPGVPFWTEALRVAKPGAHLIAFGGTRTFHRLTVAIEDAGWEIRDCLMWLYGSGFPKSHNLKGERQGWGTALKPAWEPIVLARKPLIGTVAANVQKFGTGAVNVDGCRIGTDPGYHYDRKGGTAFGQGAGPSVEVSASSSPLGRWPANVCLDETAAAMLDEQSGELVSGTMRDTPRGNRGGFSGPMPNLALGHVGDSGGASRFFYCAKSSRSDRGEGNTHPTVKPTKLMRWLCKLVTPPGGLILDPFAGSGTTGVAALAEQFNFIGIEQSPEYVEIARARVRASAALLSEEVA